MRFVVLKPQSRAAESEADSSYRFRGATGHVTWPVDAGRGLGATGTWNALLRLGRRPQWGCCDDLCDANRGDVLFASADVQPNGVLEPAISRWLEAGGTVVATGEPEAWLPFFPTGCSLEGRRAVSPYGGLAYIMDGAEPELVAPSGWQYFTLKPLADGDVLPIGSLATIGGERQTPGRALVCPVPDAPAAVRRGAFFYLNANPFAALQAWLQGQEDLAPWLGWRNRLFWLDEFVAFLGRLLQECGVIPAEVGAEGVAGLRATTVVLRHDLDWSRDTTYLEQELEAKLPAVHAVLRNRDVRFWLEHLQRASQHEIAFHYNTGAYSRGINGVKARLGLGTRGIRPSRRAIVRRGLLKQVRWARRHGIGIATLHRHLSFMLYPEWIDALHCVFEAETDVRGASSLFRGHVLRWGVSSADGNRGTYGDFPDAQFPYWLPFKLAHAGFGGQPLRGWESASVMEIEPELFEQMLDHDIPELEHKVLTLNYHPAHAQVGTFTPGGSAAWYQRILRIIRERDVDVRTLEDVFVTMDDANISDSSPPTADARTGSTSGAGSKSR